MIERQHIKIRKDSQSRTILFCLTDQWIVIHHPFDIFRPLIGF